MRLALTTLIAVAALTAPSTATSTDSPDMACYHGNGQSVGNSLFHCWCVEWAHTNTTRYRICRVINWSDGRQTALPPHE